MAQRRKALAKVATTLNVPVVKYGVIAVALVLWGFGLTDQLHSWDMTAKYLLLSAVIGAVALIA